MLYLAGGGNAALAQSREPSFYKSIRGNDPGAGVNDANAMGATALMWCAGDLAKVRYLVSKGADVNARAKSARTALLMAALLNGAGSLR